MSRFRTAFPILACDDLGRALAFYRDRLGLAETFRFPADGEPGFVALRLGDAELGLAATSGAPLHGKPVGPRGGQRFELCVYADDVDAAIAELRAAGVPVLVEPADQPWGERLAYVEDPEGNPVMVCAALPSAG